MPRSTRFAPAGFVAFAFALLTLTGAAFAQKAAPVDPDLSSEEAPSRGTANVSPEVAQKAAAIARQTMSPFCPGRTLSDCPSEYATQWRRDIRAMVAAGMSAAEIQAELEKRVNENLSGSPNRDASYIVPIGLSVGAALVLFFVFARLRDVSRGTDKSQQQDDVRRTETVGKNAAEELPAVDDARLAQELEELED